MIKEKLMKSKFLVLLSVAVMWSPSLLADPATYNGWQWNNNVKIDFIYGYWKNLGVQVHMDNGEFCYIDPSEKELLSIVLAMRAQNSLGQVVCELTPGQSVDGKDSRHIHRVRY